MWGKNQRASNSEVCQICHHCGHLSRTDSPFFCGAMSSSFTGQSGREMAARAERPGLKMIRGGHWLSAILDQVKERDPNGLAP